MNRLYHQYSFYIDLSIIIIAALFFRLVGVGINHVAVGDEMFHVLAAQSWANNGTLQIADGIYDRAALFTKLVGEIFKFTGTSLVAARLPALVFGVLWVLILYIWVRITVNRSSAWLAAGMLCIAPHAIELSLYSRMYTFQGTLFLLGCALTYSVLSSELTSLKKLSLSVISIFSFSLALHLHPITIIGLLALGLAATVDLLTQQYKHLTKKYYRLLLLILLIAICMIVLALKLNWLGSYIDDFVTPAFANQGDGIRYYHKQFLSVYPTFWSLFPVMIFVAIYKQPRISIFCCLIFITAFVLHSIAGRKAERYIIYSLPFLFIIWGIALSLIIPFLIKKCTKLADTFIFGYCNFKDNKKFIAIFNFCLILFVTTFLLVSSGSIIRTINLLKGESYYFGLNLANWELAKNKLQPLVEIAPIVMTTNFPKTLYYYGRFDVTFSKVVLHDVVNDQEFGYDFRTGRPVISTVESLHKIFSKHPHGIFIGEKSEWRNRFRLNDAAADYLEKNAVTVILPKESRVFAFTW